MEKHNKSSNPNTPNVLTPEPNRQRQLVAQPRLATTALRHPNETWDNYATRVLRSSWWIW